jgi:eukaryotic-like serine/threonine-protein kinase
MGTMNSGTEVTHIGKYDVTGILGVGGMGVVYRGMDKTVGRDVAIKTLTEATPELRQRFLVEARSGILNHQNIVTVYDFGEQDGNPYIVMEYVPGDSLENLLRGGRTFSLIEKLEIVQQTCMALGYAHQKGVIHRDIKPANIMVQPDGNIKIVDFGVARLTDVSGHTQTGAVIGTFHYISPERLLGKPFDGRADIWSAGIMMYLLLARRMPFAGEDAATLQKVVNEPFEPLSNVLTNYPVGIDHILERALAKLPSDRYETAEEMAADIELVNEELKRSHVAEALVQVRQLMEQEQFVGVRPMLLELQKMTPQDAEIKMLLREVQDKLVRQQKAEKLRQIMGQAEEAVLLEQYTEAVDFYSQALAISPGNQELEEKIQNVRQRKQTADKIALLLQQAREARTRGDFETAGQLLDQAIQLDGRSTSLRNERARVIQDAERAAKEVARQQFTRAGREQLAGRQFTEAIKNLRSALEIDPTDAEVQAMYESAVGRQEELRRRKIIEQIVAEIQSSIFSEEFDRALSQIRSAQEKLPGEAILLQLKDEAEAKQRELYVRKLVESTSLQVYSLFLTSPNEALTHVRTALEQVPGEPRLVALEEKVLEQQRKSQLEETKALFLKRAQDKIDAQEFGDAVQILETATAECGQSSDITFLLTFARDQKRKNQLRLTASNAMRDARGLIANGDLEGALALLQPAAAETGDPSVDQLLRQTAAALAELNRRVEAVAERVQSLSDQDAARALIFLNEQPPEIQQHSRIRELRARLDKIVERDRLTIDALRQAIDALQRRDLRNGLNGLESVRRSYGDSPRLASAIAECQKKRTQMANEMLAGSIEAANQAGAQQNPIAAKEALTRVTDSAEFADSPVQAEYKRLVQVYAKPGKAPKPQKVKPVAAVSNAPVAVPGEKSKLPLLIGVVVVLLLIIGGIVFWLMRPKVPVITTGTLQVNATPYAEIVSITAADGKQIALPVDAATPLRLDGVPAGNYSIVLKGPNGVQPPQPCTVSASGQACNFSVQTVGDTEIDEILGGTK